VRSSQDESVRTKFTAIMEKILENREKVDNSNVEDIWLEIKSVIESADNEIVGISQMKAKKPWTTIAILKKMDEKRRWKSIVSRDEQEIYKKLKYEIQIMCRQAKNEYFNTNFEEIKNYMIHTIR